MQFIEAENRICLIFAARANQDWIPKLSAVFPMKLGVSAKRKVNKRAFDIAGCISTVPNLL